MKRIDSAVKKETLYIAIWVVILSAIMESVFLIIGKWELSVLYGNLLSGGVSILNFFLMALSVQNAVGKDEKSAKLTMKLSQMLRMLMMLGALILGVTLSCFNIWTSIIPYFFPRIAITFRGIRKNTQGSKDSNKKDNIEEVNNESLDGSIDDNIENVIDENAQENEEVIEEDNKE